MSSDSGPAFDGGVPSWRTSLSKWEWFELTGTSLSQVPIPNPDGSGPVTPAGRVDAWNGLAANRDDDRVYLACAGGHADWSGNEVYEIDLSQEHAAWHVLRDPTTSQFISSDVDYYSDGRPSSTHLYYALQFVRAKNRIFKMSAGSVWGTGNHNDANVDGFDLASNDWDPKGTWTVGPSGISINRPYGQDPDTDDLYTFGNAAFWRWSASTATWQSLAPRPAYANDDIVQGSPAAVDPSRSRVVFFHNAYKPGQGLLLTFAGALSDITLGGPQASAAYATQLGVQYVPSEDAFFVKSGSGGEVLRVDPMTFATTTQPTSGASPPDAVNGVFTRWLYLPLLKGFVYLPSHAANMWFLATE